MFQNRYLISNVHYHFLHINLCCEPEIQNINYLLRSCFSIHNNDICLMENCKPDTCKQNGIMNSYVSFIASFNNFNTWSVLFHVYLPPNFSLLCICFGLFQSKFQAMYVFLSHNMSLKGKDLKNFV